MSNNFRIIESFILPTYAIWWRDVVRFFRQRHRVTGAFLTPVLFWLLLGAGFSVSFQDPTGSASYTQFYFSGTLALIMLFTAIFSTVTVIEDLREGFLQYALVSPAQPASIVTGKLLGGTTLALLQSSIFCVFAPFSGISLGAINLIPIALSFLISSFALTALGFLTAWPCESTASYHALMNLILLPLWMLSSALFPLTPSSGVLWWIYLLNPVSYCVSSIRHALQPNPWLPLPHTPSLSLSLILSAIFAILLFIACLTFVQKRKSF